MSPARRALALVTGVAVVARAAVVIWAASRFPAAGDGTYYDLLARRLADGLGYTWAWPDGAVTYAAHYPVGYPALLAAAYRVLGAHVGVAMAVNAAFGTALALAVQALVARAAGVRRGLVAGLLVALHPALLFYTPALMTEGLGAALSAAALAAAVVLAARDRPALGAVVAGVVLGIATLVRPQLVLLAPIFGAVAALAAPGETRRPWWRGAGLGAVTLGVALVVTAPWALRNCARMDRCGLSFNGGWNLLIGTQTTDGAWAPVDVPAACRTVWAEAAKDACFGDDAKARILTAPGRFVAAMPRKIAVTFDYFGGGPWYLHTANDAAFPEAAKVALGALETLVARLVLVAALVAAGAGRRRGRLLVAVGVVSACLRHAWPAYGILAGLLLWPAPLAGVAPAAAKARRALAWGTAAMILTTMAIHGVFFGAGRYGLLVVPFVSAVAALVPLQAFAVGAKRRASTPHKGSLAWLARAPREESPSSVEHDAG